MQYVVPNPPRFKWPKELPDISPEQKRIADDFMGYWLSVLPHRYSMVENFNHKYPLRSLDSFPTDRKIRTVELGAGIGAHLHFEPLDRQEYHCIELREALAARLRQSFPGVNAVAADCQKHLPYDDNFFDRAVVVHVLEHLPDLPAALDEVLRVLKPGGLFSVVYPCDPGFAYEIARKISAEHLFRNRYKLPYRWLIRREHINSPQEIEFLLRQRFAAVEQSFFPLKVPVINFNLCIGMTVAKPA
jgi:SAM-dependent methyltransferase